MRLRQALQLTLKLMRLVRLEYELAEAGVPAILDDKELFLLQVAIYIYIYMHTHRHVYVCVYVRNIYIYI
jgi:hypothetical protein